MRRRPEGNIEGTRIEDVAKHTTDVRRHSTMSRQRTLEETLQDVPEDISNDANIKTSNLRVNNKGTTNNHASPDTPRNNHVTFATPLP